MTAQTKQDVLYRPFARWGTRRIEYTPPIPGAPLHVSGGLIASFTRLAELAMIVENPYPAEQ